MSILKAYGKGTGTRLNKLTYVGMSNGRGPLVEKTIPSTVAESGNSTNPISARIDDTVRITKFLGTPEGTKFIVNTTAANALEVANQVKKKGKFAFLTAGGKVLLNTGKVIASTLAQVPLSGTGVHLVKGFNPDTYLVKDSGLGISSFLNLLPNIEGNPFTKEGKEVNVKATQEKAYDSADKADKANPIHAINFPSPGDSLSGRQVVNKLFTTPNLWDGKEKDNTDDTSTPLSNRQLINPRSVYNTRELNKLKKENRIGLGDPGLVSYNITSNYTETSLEGRDKVNYLSPYEGDTIDRKDTRDIIKFRFQVITPDNRTNLHFRALLDLFDDAHSGTWNSFNYVGRGEQFHTYNTYGRTISLGFKIAAQSRYEMRPLYEKIRFLASSTAPTYSTGGFMRGTFVKLTVGSYLYEVPGIMESVNYTWNTDYPWEIAMTEPEETNSNVSTSGVDNRKYANKFSDEYMKELPMILDCRVQFRPIHDFIPVTSTRLEPTRFISEIPRREEGLQRVDAKSFNNVTPLPTESSRVQTEESRLGVTGD